MSCGGRPGPVELNDLVNISIGDVYTVPGGCCPDIAWRHGDCPARFSQRGGSFPNNGEFNIVESNQGCGACGLVRLGYGCECSGGMNGNKFGIQRVAYNGDPTQCCISGAQIDGSYTCNPEYNNASSPSCSSALNDYCSQGANMFTNPRCGEWATANPNEYNNAMGMICNAMDLTLDQYSGQCISWCMQNPGKCNTSMQNYCTENPDISMCSCYASTAAMKNIFASDVNPSCIDANCIQHGYQFYEGNLNCPNEVTCIEQLNLKNSGIAIAPNINLQQNCGNTTTPSATTTQPQESFLKKYELEIMIGFVLLIIIISVTLLILEPTWFGLSADIFN